MCAHAEPGRRFAVNPPSSQAVIVGRADQGGSWRPVLPLVAIGVVTVGVLPFLPSGTLDSSALQSVFTVAFILAWVMVLVLARSRRRMISWDRTQLSVCERPFPFGSLSAEVSDWVLPAVGTRSGTVLHLRAGSRYARVGVRGPVPVPGEATAPPADRVDVVVSSDDFTQLVALLRPQLLPAQQALSKHSGAPVCQVPLVRRRTLAVALRGAWPFFIAVAVAAVAGAAAASTIIATGTGNLYPRMQLTGAGMTVVLVLGVIGTVVVSRHPPRPDRMLTIDRNMVTLAEPDGRVIAAAPRPAVGVARSVHQVTSRSGTRRYPVLTLAIPGERPLAVGGQAQTWPDPVPKGPAPDFMVGPADWAELLMTLRNGR
jgi:hypothetical protein